MNVGDVETMETESSTKYQVGGGGQRREERGGKEETGHTRQFNECNVSLQECIHPHRRTVTV